MFFSKKASWSGEMAAWGGALSVWARAEAERRAMTGRERAFMGS
jgi:hypothetical protein